MVSGERLKEQLFSFVQKYFFNNVDGGYFDYDLSCFTNCLPDLC